MIVVTGAGSGIGKAISQRLLSLGYTVLGISKNENNYIDHDNFNYVKADVSNIRSLHEIISNFKFDRGGITGIINCAGVWEPTMIGSTNIDKAYNMIATNLLGTFNVCEVFVPLMPADRHCPIINISSLTAHVTNESSIYSATKSAVESYTKSLALQLSNTLIRPNIIAPGPIKTNLTRFMPDKTIQMGIDQQILKRQFYVEDVCDIVEVLLDKKTGSLAGQVFNIGGV